ncbi:MAG: M20/M25/M40 family metallo-hydrolase [Acidimicrobiia bacterium]|nr:M20/M25/M40 family metallo-hydrolase [Acidimicrobiia bacterium]MYB23840.1 M20/M25/M40 family metallo-hydrolase [Acidimicrobiia bacterium]MYJ14584.1 M20/M25/M40 family metallo-hydrolase [Acidimicrobiia bacterium]
MDRQAAGAVVSRLWRDEILPQLQRYIAIPALSPAFDSAWEQHGHIESAVAQVAGWLRSRPVAGMSVDVQRLPGRTPLIVVEVAPSGPSRRADLGAGGVAEGSTVVLYGHLDKQPEMTGWREGLGPWTPVLDGHRLYGRGGADDGYAAFAALAAIEAVQAAGGRHSRCMLLIEASEESGSPDLAAHLGALGERLGDVSLLICLDSGCADYDTLWLTTSLRGLVEATLRVDVINEGWHSGMAGGLVPSSFRLARILLERIEEADTGGIRLEAAQVEVPPHRRAEAAAMAELLGGTGEDFGLVGDLQLMETHPAAGLLARTWGAALAVTGADGLPATASAGNVLRPYTALKLSLRLPPTADAAAAAAELRDTLLADPPLQASVTVAGVDAADGWDAPDLAPWLAEALQHATRARFGRPLQLYGEGGSIPFLAALAEMFPQAQFVVTGVLGPESNAHGPNEFLHLSYAEKLTCCMAEVLHAEAVRTG